MSEKFQNKYRIKSTRLAHWNYGWNASYFVTICTHQRSYFFGEIMNEEMILNNIGLIAQQCWIQIPHHFPFIELGPFVIMPNHIHGILTIDKPDVDNVETRLIASLPPKTPSINGGITGNNNPMLHENLSKIIRWYKGRTTFESRKLNLNFAWQPRYFDHIIKNGKAFEEISAYIINNPTNWEYDRLR